MKLKSVWSEVFPLYGSYEDYFKFTYVRNLQIVEFLNGTILNAARGRKSRMKNTWSAYCLFVRKQCKDSFGNFVKNSSKLDQQINWIYDDAGNNLMDYVGKLEEIDTSLETIAPHLGIDFDDYIPYINKSHVLIILLSKILNWLILLVIFIRTIFQHLIMTMNHFDFIQKK